MAESDDFREFIREITLRFERGMAAISEDIRADVAVSREESRRYLDAIHKNTDEIIAEGRAGREALFRILDKFDGHGGGAAPAG